MPNEAWMQPALQTNEAVLLPALERRTLAPYRFGNRYLMPASSEEAFQPANENWGTVSPELALSTYVRPRGSMAGRSVLRAAGIRTEPFYQRQKRYPRFPNRPVR